MDGRSFSSEAMGNRIKEKRDKMGYTQEHMAQLLGMRRETYNTIEKGKRALKDSEIFHLARILNTSCDYLLSGTETENLSIKNEIGLTDKAINTLKKFRAQWDYIYELQERNEEVEEKVLDECFGAYTILCGLDDFIQDKLGQEILRDMFTFLHANFSTGYIAHYIKRAPSNYVIDDKTPIEHICFRSTNGIPDFGQFIIRVEALENSILSTITKNMIKLKERYNEQTSKR